MLSILDASLSFSERRIFQHLSFTINDSEKVALVGPNGVGKTTILRVIVDEVQLETGKIILPSSGSKVSYVPQYLKLDPDEENLTVFEFLLESRNLDTINKRLLAIGEELEGNLHDKSLENLLNEQHQLFEAFHEAEGYKAEDDILNLIVGIGLEVDFDQKVRTLSGGQKTKLALARLLYDQSEVLLLDEPTNHIEKESVVWLADYLKNSSKTVLVVSHLPEFLNRFIGKVIYLSGHGEAKVYFGNYDHFIKIKAKEDLRNQRAQQKLSDDLERQKSIVGHTIQRQSGLKHSREKVVAKLENQLKTATSHQKNLRLSFAVHTRLHGHALIVDQISKSFGKKTLFSRLSFLVNAKDRFGVIGENGTGKTTFLRILAGDLMPDQGSVRRNPHLEIGWYRQEQENLQDNLTIIQEVEKTALSPQYLRSILAYFLFPTERIDQVIGTLSRGERARLALCKTIMSKPNLLLLDEPTNHLDISARESLRLALQRYEGAVVLVTHDIEFMASIGISWALKFPDGHLVQVQGRRKQE